MTSVPLTQTSDKKAFTFERMDTTHFIPTEDYVKRCVENPIVRRFREGSRRPKPIYIITGIKIVHGAQGTTTTSRGVKGVVGAQVDGTLLSGGIVPVGGGPEISHGRTSKSAISWEGSTDFVFAFKVSEVRVSQAGTVKGEREYTKGALLEDADAKKQAVAVAISTIDGVRIESLDGYKSMAVDDGNAVVMYGVPVATDKGA